MAAPSRWYDSVTLGDLSALGAVIPVRGPGDRDIAVGMEVAGNGAEAPGSRKIGGRIPKWLNSVRWTAPSIGGERAI